MNTYNLTIDKLRLWKEIGQLVVPCNSIQDLAHSVQKETCLVVTLSMPIPL